MGGVDLSSLVEGGEAVRFPDGAAFKSGVNAHDGPEAVPQNLVHKIRSASISKVAVGMAAMILREEGVIDLDESIGTYWDVPVSNPAHPDIPVPLSKAASMPMTDQRRSPRISSRYLPEASSRVCPRTPKA